MYTNTALIKATIFAILWNSTTRTPKKKLQQDSMNRDIFFSFHANISNQQLDISFFHIKRQFDFDFRAIPHWKKNCLKFPFHLMTNGTHWRVNRASHSQLDKFDCMVTIKGARDACVCYSGDTTVPNRTPLRMVILIFDLNFSPYAL